MPTGYTADVGDGTLKDFRTFVLRCARNFGATIHQRDDNSDEPPKHREVEPYHADRIVESHQRIAELEAMTPEQIAAGAAKANQEELEEHNRQVAKEATTKANYEAMLVKVREWEPPTEEHLGLRHFMIEQLNESIRFDCGYYEGKEPPAPKEPSVWYMEALNRAHHDLRYHKKGLADEQERCRKVNAWIDALYESLRGVTA